MDPRAKPLWRMALNVVGSAVAVVWLFQFHGRHMGTGWYCRLLKEQVSLVRAVELRRACLLALLRTQQRLEAAMESEAKGEGQRPRRRDTEEVLV